jgi:hypothetical protein
MRHRNYHISRWHGDPRLSDRDHGMVICTVKIARATPFPILKAGQQACYAKTKISKPGDIPSPLLLIAKLLIGNLQKQAVQTSMITFQQIVDFGLFALIQNVWMGRPLARDWLVESA